VESELLYDHLLCPNVTNIQIEGSVLSKTRFSVHVKGKEAAFTTGAIENAIAYSSEITRFFNVETYYE